MLFVHLALSTPDAQADFKIEYLCINIENIKLLTPFASNVFPRHTLQLLLETIPTNTKSPGKVKELMR